MKKLSKVFLIVLIAVLMLAVIVIGLYISKNDLGTLRQERVDNMETIDGLTKLIENRDFVHTTDKAQIDNLEQIIKSKDELIMELKVEEEILELYKETLEYAYVYIYYAQTLLMDNRIPYFEFIGEQILDDDYFEDIEEQEEVFEELNND